MTKPPIRILYLIDDLWSSLGGSEQHLLWLLRTIPEPEFEEHLIVFSNIHSEEPVIMEHRPVVLGPEFGIGGRSWFRRLRCVARFIRDNRIDLVHAFGPMGEAEAVLAVRLARRGRVLGNRRDCGYDKSARNRWIFWLAKVLKTRYVANSEAARQAAFRNNGTPLDSIAVIRNPVSRKRIEEALHEPVRRDELPFLRGTPGEKIVGMVATVRPIKDYGTLIRAAKTVLEKYPNTWFVFVGDQDSNHKAELEHIAEECGVTERIVWFGKHPNPLRIVPCFDVAVLSSHSESFSNAVLEYAAAERPIVVSDVGGLGEIVRDGETGYLVPPENPGALAEKILRLLDDPQLARRFGIAARQYVFERYDEQKILEQYIDKYREMVENEGE